MQSKISVIVPSRWNDKFPQNLIDSIRNSNYPQEKIEIIISYGSHPPLQRNEAAKKAAGEILFFIDNDCTIDAELFNQLIKHFDSYEIAAVGGPNLLPKNSTFSQKAQDCVFSSIFGTYSGSSRYSSRGKIRFSDEKELILCNLCFKKDIFLKEEGLNETLFPNDENELLNRLRTKSYKFIYNPHALVYHQRRGDFISFAKQIANYGRGRARQILINPKFSDLIYFLPLIFCCYILSLFFLRNQFYLIPLFAYILLDFAFSFYESIKSRDLRFFPLLLILFPLLHISYGIGNLYGFITGRFKIKNYSRKVEVKLIKG
jgi:GT2 family glycosyltransferase